MFDVTPSGKTPEPEVPGTRDDTTDQDEPITAPLSEQELDQVAGGDAGARRPYPPYI